MPVYEYICSKCDQRFEHLVRSMNGEERVTCPECGGARVKRRLSVFAARHGSSPEAVVPGGACRRCGDPDGPCTM
jgi:putative FmdB family regulatory protein